MPAANSTSLLPLFLDPVLIHQQLGELATAFRLEVVRRCDSTNTQLLHYSGPEDGRVAVLAAEHQYAGRGRRGREWLAWPGSSLTFSSRWCFSQGSPAPTGLSLAAGLAVATALESLGLEYVGLKWPNDIWVCQAKLGGILTELQTSAQYHTVAVIGIGLNLTIPTPSSITNQAAVTSLNTHLSPAIDPNRLLADILRALHDFFQIYSAQGFAPLRPAWEQRNVFADQRVVIHGEGLTTTSGRCLGIANDGALLLQTEQGTTRILSGDVSLRPEPRQ